MNSLLCRKKIMNIYTIWEITEEDDTKIEINDVDKEEKDNDEKKSRNKRPSL